MTRPEAPPPDRRRLDLALQAAGLGEFELDLVRDVFIVSERMGVILGLEPGEWPAQGGSVMDAFVHPDDVPGLAAQRATDLASRDRFEVEFRHIRPDDGRVRCIRSAGIITRGPDGRARTVTGIVQDVTARRLEEDQRNELMSELDHRVKNVLATVQSLAVQTARGTTSLQAFLANFSGRLKALASANELLTAARWRGAAVEHLATAVLKAIAPAQTRLEGPEVFLTPRAANALSLALHELAANAVKFGALSTEAGQVDVRWRLTSDGGFELTWIESGGPSVAPPTRHGFGSTLLEQVTGRELNGEASIEFPPAGVRVRLRAGPQAIAPRPDTLPDAPARVVETVAASAGPASLKGARVLIVEDAVLLALELETGLSEAGAEVLGPAYELEEAMALLNRPIDAAVLDANLNGRSAIPVAEALARRGIPFVFATGYAESGGPPGGFDAPVIRKPYDVTEVAAAVAGLLAAS